MKLSDGIRELRALRVREGMASVHRILYTRAETRPGRTLLVRLLIVWLLSVLVIAIFWLDRDGLQDAIDGDLSFIDVLYFTAVTITTTGYGDIIPVSPRARAIDALVITPIRLVIWFIFLGTTYQLVVQKMLEEYRMKKLQRRLQGHIILCGYGGRGRVAAKELVELGHASDEVVVVDKSEQVLMDAAGKGFVGLAGDMTREAILTNAGVATAGSIIVCPGRDDTTVLTVLTIRHLNPTVKIIASVEEEENTSLIRQSGADVVVPMPKLAGYLLADAVVRTHTADYVCDLLSAGGTVVLSERPARPDEVGLALREVRGAYVVKLLRDGEAIAALDQPDMRIREDDLLILIERGPGQAGEGSRSGVD